MQLELKDIKPGMKFRFTPTRVAEFRHNPEYGVTNHPNQVYVVARIDSSQIKHVYPNNKDGPKEFSSYPTGCDFITSKPIILIKRKHA